ncbi:MAG: VTT domain-containing protein [Desulfurococcales archaeon]|nr:VTT domain-containing protein [Desulfurococcales archaeon]
MNIVDLLDKLNEYGPPGLFLVSFISNAIPGFPAIYLAFVGTYALVATDTTHASLAIIVSGLGAGLGKLFVFMSSRALGRASKRLKSVKEKTEWLGEEAEKGVFILVLLFAALPLPDDILYIPLGLTGFRAASFAIAVILGKIILTALVFFLGRAYKSLFESITSASAQENLGLLVGGMVVASIIATAIIFSMDWKKIYMTYKRHGSIKATLQLILELVRVATFNFINPENPPAKSQLCIALCLSTVLAPIGYLYTKDARYMVISWITVFEAYALYNYIKTRAKPVNNQ